MFNVSKYLEKFSKNIQSFDLNKKQIIEVILKHTQLNINSDLIEIKNDIIYLKNSPAFKNKIFMFKQQILDDINSNNSKKVTDIR